MCGAMFKRAHLEAAKEIVVDPRRIGLAEDADFWLQLSPGSECALALAMINVITSEDLYDHEFVEKYGFGFHRLADHVRSVTPAWTAPITRLPASLITEAARTFATTKHACIQWGNGIDMSTNAFQTGRAVPRGSAARLSLEGVVCQPPVRGRPLRPGQLGQNRSSATGAGLGGHSVGVAANCSVTQGSRP